MQRIVRGPNNLQKRKQASHKTLCWCSLKENYKFIEIKMTAQGKIKKIVKDRIYFNEFLTRTKTKLRSSRDDTVIALFVLQVAQLEYSLKHSIGIDNDTLGGVIKKWHEKFKNVDTTKIKDYRIKALFHSKYIASFKRCSYEINKLRNNLYHNLFRGTDSDHDLKEVLRQIKEHTEYRNISYEIDSEFDKNLGDLVSTTNYRSLVDENSIPKSWTLELLIEISKYYKNYGGIH